MTLSYRSVSIYGSRENDRLFLEDEVILCMFRTRHEMLGRRPNTAEMARILKCSEAQVANALARARQVEYERHYREQAEWDEASQNSL